MTEARNEEEGLQSPVGLEGRENAKKRLALPHGFFDLNEVKQRLTRESEWTQNGRNQFALAHEGALRIGLFGFQDGTGIQNHKVNGPIAVYVLSGNLHVEAQDRDPVDLKDSGFCVVDGLQRFTFVANGETFAVITFCQAESEADPVGGNEEGTALFKWHKA